MRVAAPRRVWAAALIALAITAAFVAGAAVAVKLDSLWRPPNHRELIGRLTEEHVLELLEQIGRRHFAGDPILADDKKKLETAGVHYMAPLRDGTVIRAVRFEFGGADNHYGLLMTQDSSAPNIGCTVTPVKPNLWYYSEIPPRR
jgi:hypothetical protein